MFFHKVKWPAFRILIFFIGTSLLSLTELFAQTNWVNRLNYSWEGAGMYTHNDSVCGVINAVQSPDGNIYLLAKVDQSNYENLVKTGPNGGQFYWSIYQGEYHTLSKEEAVSLRATADSGCILFLNSTGWASYYHTDACIKKYSSAGTLQWSKWFYHNPDANPLNDIRIGYDIIQNASGNYYALIEDSLFEVDGSGNVIFSSGAISGTQLHELPGGDLLVRTHDSTIVRTDLSGDFLWTFSSVNATDVVSFTDPAAFVCTQSGQLTKVDAATGDTVWSVPVGVASYSSIDATQDGGAIIAKGEQLFGSPQTTMSGELVKYDADGNLEWYKSYDFPHYGLSYVSQLPSGKYFTGGTYLAEDYISCPVDDYNGFAAIVDSTGEGDLQIASYLWPSDADVNDTVDFTTDGLFVAMAMGATGTPRDHENFMGYIYPPFEWVEDYAVDWSQSFPNGVNYKHADFNGDGIIDSLDLVYPIAFGPIIIYCKEESPSHIETLPDFKLVPEHDVVAPGEVMKFYIVTGTQSMPVNSLYGFATVLNADAWLLDNSMANVVAYSSDFGTQGVDLYKYDNTSHLFDADIMSVLFCRTDQNNVSQLSDTIGYIELKSLSTISSATTFNLTFNSFNAITADLAKVPLNTISASVLIDPTYTGNGQVENKIEIYPNPSSQFLTIKTSSNDEKEVSIIDAVGRNVKALQFWSRENRIDVNDLPPGNYTLKVSVNGKESVSPFVVQR